MGFIFEQRFSDSPYIQTVTRGVTVGEGSTIRPAETSWHLVFTRVRGRIYPILTGPLTSSGVVRFSAGAELLWIKFKLGAFMPHLPPRNFLDREQILPGASAESFWLQGSTWQLPDFENVETFAERLARSEILVRDPLVEAALQGRQARLAPRTLRHRFLCATGLSHNQVRQFERAQKAAALLQSGVSILDAVFDAGYYDQPHLTRALKKWIGRTPAQIVPLQAE